MSKTSESAPDAQAGTVAAVLAAHYSSPNAAWCRCGWRASAISPGRVPVLEQYATHVAAALAAAGLTTEADQPRDGLRAAVEALFHETFTPDFGGFDWRSDNHIQRFAVRLAALLADQPPTPPAYLDGQVERMRAIQTEHERSEANEA